MELVMQQEITEIVPASIAFNYEELKSEISSKLARYQNMVITENDIVDAKKDKSALNKLATALNDQRIAHQREYMRPFDLYKERVDELVRMIKEPVETIDRQVKAFDEARKEEKREALAVFFRECASDLSSLIPFEKIFNARWLNATYKQIDAEQEITDTLNRARNDIGIIKKMGTSCEREMIDKYLQTLDMSAALAEKTRIENLKKSLEETVFRTTRTTDEYVPVPPAPVTVQTPAPIWTQVCEKSAQPVDIRVWVTDVQKAALKDFLVKNNIKYGSVN